MRFLFFIIFSTCLFANENDIVKDIYKLSLEVRGNTHICGSSGDEYFVNLNEIITLGLNDPIKYEKQLPNKQDYEEATSKDREYFRFWAVRSISNFILFNDFNDAYTKLIPKLTDYYITKFGFSKQRAIFFAIRLANEFLYMSVGNYEKAYKLSTLERMATNPNLNKEEFISLIYTNKPTRNEITNLLNIALLYNQNEDILQTLIDFGASINGGDESALFFALKNMKNVEFLIKHGANINYENSFGKTALFYAIDFGDIDLIKFLVENGANTNHKYINKSGKDAIASGFRNIPFYQNLCALEHTSRTVFMHAAFHSVPEVLDLLIKNGANIDDIDDMGYNALDYAIWSKNKENIMFLESLQLKSNLEGEI
ncbi:MULTISPECIES: ankyrin repeat domain-containing protein [Campylobacter]|uniref:ankyrin repeat domain-containing protein n=1 Tax=Campylobacter TaxID=194 RepID=UPI00138DF1D9|nr:MULTISPECIES: ankyrin repeat domain-containing protein [Campylobacter]MDV2489389.1 ankyrin repeat domain-containing protein [Campylobacter sp. TJR-1]